ncbi:uncharacterized protein LOC106657667 [Trichogramma pretiosum]|uniref:uncharacterized protein LOC106657667 n=1 Tax=Trichogramma pretiosum TaxID=7493 RepID=UPI0006C9BAD6|nr:uncharacterized protein LOC106657667 [Trichogramma pretiosum]XP_023317778.1 uncharacterized protein LOC106657667 [Trichogramma pretiosum]
MEDFLKIDWCTNIEDIVDERFVNEERMKTESCTYKLLGDTFVDPFAHLRSAEDNLYTNKKVITRQQDKKEPKKKKGTPRTDAADVEESDDAPATAAATPRKRTKKKKTT